MKEEPPKQLRVRTVGTKLTDREYAQCEKSAARRGQTLSEWCRQVLLAAVESPAQRPEDEAILSEILALRKIVINLLYGQTAGEPLSEERMQELIEAADSDSSAKQRNACNPQRSWSLERSEDQKIGVGYYSLAPATTSSAEENNATEHIMGLLQH